jgi:phosphatidylinositol 3-kinase
MEVWKLRRRASQVPKMRWGGWRRCNSPLSIETASELKDPFQLVKKHERGDMPKSEWLDKLVFRRMSEIHAVRTFMPSRVVHIAKGNEGGD